jgi:hypothetical protein
MKPVNSINYLERLAFQEWYNTKEDNPLMSTRPLTLKLCGLDDKTASFLKINEKGCVGLVFYPLELLKV